MAQNAKRLWDAMYQAADSVTNGLFSADGEEGAKMIRAMADHIAPEEDPPSATATDLAKGKWLARKEIRDRLLDEADLAEDIP